MLFLLLRLGTDRYALAAQQIVAVLPRLSLKAIPRAPPAVAGLCRYQGAAVPVLDLSELALGRPAAALLSTRIVLVQYRVPGDSPQLLGLLAEGVTESRQLEADDFAPPGVRSMAAPWLGTVAVDALGLIQRIEVDQLLPEALRSLLFQANELA